MLSSFRTLGATAALLLGVSATASAFDGQVQGFLLGAGIGPAFLTSQTYEISGGSRSISEDLKTEGLPIQFNWLIGGAWDNQDALFYNGHVSYYTLEDDDKLSATSRGMLSYRRYFLPEGPTAYAEAGAGVGVFINPDLDEPFLGSALQVAGGYMFRSHFSVEVGLDWSSVDYKHDGYAVSSSGMNFSTVTIKENISLTSLYVTINALAF